MSGQATRARLANLAACESFDMPAAEEHRTAAWLASKSALEAAAAAAAHSLGSGRLLQGTNLPARLLH